MLNLLERLDVSLGGKDPIPGMPGAMLGSCAGILVSNGLYQLYLTCLDHDRLSVTVT